jgi:hypothetical protein
VGYSLDSLRFPNQQESSVQNRGPVLHQGVSLIVCDNAAVLQETLVQANLSEVEHQFFSDRAVVIPTGAVLQIVAELKARGVYPQVVGGPLGVELVEDEDDT